MRNIEKQLVIKRRPDIVTGVSNIEPLKKPESPVLANDDADIAINFAGAFEHGRRVNLR